MGCLWNCEGSALSRTQALPGSPQRQRGRRKLGSLRALLPGRAQSARSQRLTQRWEQSPLCFSDGLGGGERGPRPLEGTWKAQLNLLV